MNHVLSCYNVTVLTAQQVTRAASSTPAAGETQPSKNTQITVETRLREKPVKMGVENGVLYEFCYFALRIQISESILKENREKY